MLKISRNLQAVESSLSRTHRFWLALVPTKHCGHHPRPAVQRWGPLLQRFGHRILPGENKGRESRDAVVRVTKLYPCVVTEMEEAALQEGQCLQELKGMKGCCGSGEVGARTTCCRDVLL